MTEGRRIDHLVLCVHDLDEAAAAYERLGFTLTPRAHHDWGTDNRLVQLQSSFLELLCVAAPDKIGAHGAGVFDFGAHNRDFLERHEGMSMLALTSRDAAADQAEWCAAGLPAVAPFRFERQAGLPDGSTVTVAFTLAFATDALMPGLAFFTCQQHAPEHFWKPRYQVHDNGARDVEEVVLRAPEPAALIPFFRRLIGRDRVRDANEGLVVDTEHGQITVLDPALFAARFPAAGQAGTAPCFAAYRVSVRDLRLVRDLLDGNGVGSVWRDDTLQVLPDDLFGIALEFAEPI